MTDLPPDVEPSRWLAAIVVSAEDAIASMTLAGSIVTWNEAAERLFGFRAEEAIGKPASILFPSDRLGELGERLARLATGQRMEHLETRQLGKDGTLTDVSLSLSPVRDSSGTIVGAATIARDIRAPKRREAALRQAAMMEAVARIAGRVAHDFDNLLTAILG